MPWSIQRRTQHCDRPLPPRNGVCWPWQFWASLILAIAAIVWFPLAYLQQLDLSLDAGERHIADLQARVPGREDLLAEVRKLGDLLDTERALLPGSTPAVAAAQLQGDLAGVAAAMGGEVTTVQILEPEEVAPFARIGLRLSVVGDTRDACAISLRGRDA